MEPSDTPTHAVAFAQQQVIGTITATPQEVVATMMKIDEALTGVENGPAYISLLANAILMQTDNLDPAALLSTVQQVADFILLLTGPVRQGAAN